jgi:hypothetical protein
MAQVPGVLKPKTRYYHKRLWKVSWSVLDLGRGRVRICKFYERRPAIGADWQFIRGSVYEPRT